MRHPTPPTRNAPVAAAFTLVELLVSIAIVVVLMTGVATVFRITGDTIGAGQASGAMNRDARAAQAVFAQDFQGAARNGPFILIDSSRIGKFTNAKDQKSDRDGDPMTLDIDGDGKEGVATVPGEVVSRGSVNGRNHRLDRVALFSRGNFKSQTGPDGTFISGTTSGEELVKYQIARQPAATGTGFVDPGVGPNNEFAADWVLARSSILLLNNPPTSSFFYPSAGGEGGNYAPVKPLYVNSAANDNGGQFSWIQTNRYDVAQTSISDFLKTLRLRALGGKSGNYMYNTDTEWWQRGGFNFPLDAYPFPARPLTSAAVARTHPIFLKGVSQFIVEYAGDFVAQNNDPTDNDYGELTDASIYIERTNANSSGLPQTYLPTKFHPAINGAGTDGLIDFTVDPTNNTKRIRWYGFPRDDNGDGVIVGWTPGTRARDLVDVVPLRDVMLTLGSLPNPSAKDGAPFEKFLVGQDTKMPPKADYAASGALPTDARYICAWGPDDLGCPRPAMMRITITLVDPNGSVPNGQTYQFVYKLP